LVCAISSRRDGPVDGGAIWGAYHRAIAMTVLLVFLAVALYRESRK
jgi:hypothetical protein